MVSNLIRVSFPDCRVVSSIVDQQHYWHNGNQVTPLISAQVVRVGIEDRGRRSSDQPDKIPRDAADAAAMTCRRFQPNCVSARFCGTPRSPGRWQACPSRQARANRHREPKA